MDFPAFCDELEKIAINSTDVRNRVTRAVDKAPISKIKSFIDRNWNKSADMAMRVSKMPNGKARDEAGRRAFNRSMAGTAAHNRLRELIRTYSG